MQTRAGTALFIFLIAVLYSWNIQKAQASDEMPKKVQRNWASPDCGDYDTALIISRFFYLKSTEDEMSLMPATLSSQKQDYFVLDLAGTDTPARLENDAILKIGSYAKDSPRGPDTWDDLKLDDTEEFTGCLEAPAIVPKVLQRFMRYVDRIKEQCTLSVNNECAGVLFKLADENGDKRLSVAEIRRTVSSAVLFAALADKKTLTSQEAMKLIHDSAPQAQQVADALMAAYDKKHSGKLDYNELMADFHAPDVPIVKETLEKAGTLLPSFKVAAMTLK
jgi:hypothetical protein